MLVCVDQLSIGYEPRLRGRGGKTGRGAGASLLRFQGSNDVSQRPDRAGRGVAWRGVAREGAGRDR